MKKIALALLGLVMLANTAFAAEIVAKTEKTELWRKIDMANGVQVACYWVQNRKGMADNVSTGLACVVLDRKYVIVEKVMEPHAHPTDTVF
ncbi:MAG: hypothetical protein ACW99G_04815 [Candidatus Thorarchaeota archaeon]|jgi:hypothetical protein